MSFINKLDNTYKLLNELNNIMIKENGKDLVKKQILSLSDDLTSYKEIDNKNIKFENDEIKLKMQDVLNRIHEIQINVKNKLIITEKYNSYINS